MADKGVIRLTGPGGESLLGEDVGFSPIREDWSEYELADGSVLKIRIVAQKVSRAIDPETRETFHKEEDGEPLYNVRYQIVVSTSVPEDLLKQD